MSRCTPPPPGRTADGFSGSKPQSPARRRSRRQSASRASARDNSLAGVAAHARAGGGVQGEIVAPHGDHQGRGGGIGESQGGEHALVGDAQGVDEVGLEAGDDLPQAAGGGGQGEGTEALADCGAQADRHQAAQTGRGGRSPTGSRSEGDRDHLQRGQRQVRLAGEGRDQVHFVTWLDEVADPVEGDGRAPIGDEEEAHGWDTCCPVRLLDCGLKSNSIPGCGLDGFNEIAALLWGALPPAPRQDRLEQGQEAGQALRPDDPVPGGLELLPAGAVSQVAQLAGGAGMRPGGVEDGAPAVEIAVGAASSPPPALAESCGRAGRRRGACRTGPNPG